MCSLLLFVVDSLHYFHTNFSVHIINTGYKNQLTLPSVRQSAIQRGRARLKCDGTHAETRFGISAQRTSPFKSAGGGVSSVYFWQPRCAHQR